MYYYACNEVDSQIFQTLCTGINRPSIKGNKISKIKTVAHVQCNEGSILWLSSEYFVNTK